MRHTFTIFRWEIKKILNNWRRTLVVFLLPAVIMLVALNVFPLLINYLSTGHLQSHPVLVVDAPASFQDFAHTSSKSDLYDFSFVSYEQWENIIHENGGYSGKTAKEWPLVLAFSAKDSNGEKADFDETVRDYYARLARGEISEQQRVFVDVHYDAGSFANLTQAETFILNIKESYTEHLFDYLGKEYEDVGGGKRFEPDLFNPYTFVMKNRANANMGAARTLPGILVLLMYYCVYSLSGEIMASSRESGFLTKVYLTPIPEISLLSGKMLTVVVVSSVSSILTYFLLFFSSWLNHSNSAFSLLPFGLFLTPMQLLYSFVTLLVTSFLMCALCFGIVFKIRRMEDVLLNLQIPLVLLVFEFFIMMFRPSQSLPFEFTLPVHNAVMLIRAIFLGHFQMSNFIMTILINAMLTVVLVALCIKNTDGMIHISQGGLDDTSNARK